MIALYIVPQPEDTDDALRDAYNAWQAWPDGRYAIPGNVSRLYGIAHVWYLCVTHFPLPDDAWALFVHPQHRPTAACHDALRRSMQQGPALLACPQAWQTGERFDLDWRQTDPCRPLEYAEHSPTAYAHTGGFCLPGPLVLPAVRQMSPADGQWGGGANIALARGCRNLGLDVRLVPDALLRVENM